MRNAQMICGGMYNGGSANAKLDNLTISSNTASG